VIDFPICADAKENFKENPKLGKIKLYYVNKNSND
jgi:hypothetical protein